MSTSVRTLELPKAVRPVREHGSSALDRAVVVWPAPDATARILDRWGMPPNPGRITAPWPAPDPVMRFDLPAPDLRRKITAADGRIPWMDLVEPHYVVTVPDLRTASRDAVAIAPPTVPAPTNHWAAPTPATAAPLASVAPAGSRLTTRAKVGLATAAGAVAASAAVLVALF